MSPDEFKVASASLDDNRKIIAQGKVQRWEVLKWAVALNIGLATAAVAIDRKPAALMILWATTFVAVIATLLIFYYTMRMTGARNDSVHVYKYLQRAGIACSDICDCRG